MGLFSMWLGFFAWYGGLAMGGHRAGQPAHGRGAAGGPLNTFEVLRCEGQYWLKA